MPQRHWVASVGGLEGCVNELLGYLNRLKARMERQGFPIDDELYRLVTEASNAMHALTVDVHYRSCGNVGRLG